MIKLDLRRFWRDRSGHFAMLFAIAVPTMVLAAGLSVNYGMMNTTRFHLQSALDAGILASTKEETATTTERRDLTRKFVEANFKNPYDATNLIVTLDRDDVLEQFDATATVDLPVVFGEFFGRATTPIKVSASARVGVAAVEVMLVLDKTGSMSEVIPGSNPAEQKIVSLKSAATLLVNEIMDGTKVKVGIVPFANYVNIGMGLRNEPGFDIPPDTTSCTPQNVQVWDWSSPYNCVTNPNATCWNAIYDSEGNVLQYIPYTCSQTNCQYPFTWQVQNVCNHNLWYGCVGSRMAPLDATDLQTTTAVPAVMNTWCGASQITRLTLTKATVLAGIASLQPEGLTYIPAGLMMGWHALSYRPILPDGVDPSTPAGAGTLRAMVLMTDGANTRSRDPGNQYHWGNDINAANQLTRDLCENIKADGIQLYTVAFDVGAGVVDMLEDCATSPAMAYSASNGAQLAAAFSAIGDSLSQLRLTR